MKTLWWLIAIVVIVGAGVYLWQMQQEGVTPLVTDENAVLVADQQPGDETVVSYAKLSQPGYVVVTARDASGNETVIGSSDLLPAGEHRSLRIKHRSGSINDGTRVTASIVVDDGDGVYSETDTEVAASDDAMIDADAVLDVDLSDEELHELLEEAGYTTTDEHADEATGEEGDTTTEEGDQVEEDAMMETEASMEAEGDVEGAQ